MKTELEIANERILELENQVKKLSSNTVLADSLPLSELKDTLCEVSQLIAGWNATEAQWSKWDEEVKQKVYELQVKIDGKKSVNFR